MRPAVGVLTKRLQESQAERPGKIVGRQLGPHPGRVRVNENDGVCGESDDTRISGRRLRQYRDAPICGRETTRRDVAQKSGKRLARRRIIHRLNDIGADRSARVSQLAHRTYPAEAPEPAGW